MISPLAAALYCVTSLCLAEGLFVQLGYRKQRPPNPHRAFSLFLYGMALESLGSALLTDATDLSAGTRAQTMQLVGQAVGLVAFVDFQQRSTLDESRRVIKLVRALCMALVGIAASGWMLRPGQAAGPALLTLPYAVPYRQAALSPIGIGAYTVAIATVARSQLKMHRARQGSARVSGALLWSLALAFPCVIHDQLIRFRVIDSIYLLDFAVMACTFVASSDLVMRFTHDGLELRKRNQELEQSYVRLREARDALVEMRRLAAIGELSAVIAHEVRNPLAVIKNAAAGLRRRETLPPATCKELLGIVREEVDSLTRLVDDMLTYAKPLHLKPAVQCARQLLECAVQRATGDEGNTRLTIELDDATAAMSEFEGDERLLLIALENIVANAIDAGGDGEEIRVRAHALDDCMELSVRDRGRGMDEATRLRATEPFFTTRPKGTGLGLAIAQRVAEAHGGSLCVHSEPGQGTLVSLRLPRRGRPTRAPWRPPPSSEQTGPAHSLGRMRD